MMIEAMACGTPIIAFDKGAAREVVDDGVTGLVVRTLEEGVRAVPQVLAFDRAKVRRRFEERFSADRMATDYVAVYEELLRRSGTSRRPCPVLVRADAG